MAYDFQVVVDCADPHAQAEWWARTLGWRVEPSDQDFIRRMISLGQATEADTLTRRGVLVWREAAAIRHPDDPDRGPGRRILFQRVPEGKKTKNRMHLDVRAGADQAAAVAEGLVDRGATMLYRRSQGPFSWYTLADPEGNEFCVT